MMESRFMIDLIGDLTDGARVLDLGAGPGSFPVERDGILVVRLDLEKPHTCGQGAYVLADGSQLPFRSGSFDLAVSNHSLEHFIELHATLRELGRVLKPGAGLYVAVPDAGTLTDRIYRWLGRGGGHVNPFRSAKEVSDLIARLTGIPLRSTIVLFSSLSFLNSRNFTSRPPRRIALFAFGNEKCLAILLAIWRWLDRRLGTRFSQYGWAFRFGDISPGPSEAWVNVCVRCGSGHSDAFLRKHARPGRLTYRCPNCGGFNFRSREFTPRLQ
jgi:SAM-dependent methyltransferase